MSDFYYMGFNCKRKILCSGSGHAEWDSIGEMRNNNSTINKRLRISFPLQQKFPEKNKEKGNCPSFIFTRTLHLTKIYMYIVTT